MSTIIYKCEAHDVKSYTTLAAYVVAVPVRVTLFPDSQVITIPKEALKEVNDLIDAEGLDVTVTGILTEGLDIEEALSDPTSDSTILRAIAEGLRERVAESADKIKDIAGENENLRQQVEALSKDKDNYGRWAREERIKNSRITEQVKAILVLLDMIHTQN